MSSRMGTLSISALMSESLPVLPLWRSSVHEKPWRSAPVRCDALLDDRSRLAGH